MLAHFQDSGVCASHPGSSARVEACLIIRNPSEVIKIRRALFAPLSCFQMSLECVQATERRKTSPNPHDTLIILSDPALLVSRPRDRLFGCSRMLEQDSPTNVRRCLGITRSIVWACYPCWRFVCCNRLWRYAAVWLTGSAGWMRFSEAGRAKTTR